MGEAPLDWGGLERGRSIPGTGKRGARERRWGDSGSCSLATRVSEWMREDRSWGSKGQDAIIPKPHCTSRRGWKDF